MQQLLGPDYRIIENALNARTNIHEDPYFPNRMGLKSLQVALDANAPLDLVVLQMGCNEREAYVQSDRRHGSPLVWNSWWQACKASYYNYPAPKVLVIAPAPTHPEIEQMIFGFSFGPDAYAKSLQFSREYRAMAEAKRLRLCGLCAAAF